MTQRTRGTLGYVALTIVNLHQIHLQDTTIDRDVQTCSLSSLSKRWGKMDRDAAITAVFLNPWIRHTLFKPQSGYHTLFDIRSLLERMWNRSFLEPCDDNFSEAVTQYYDRIGRWTDENMRLHVHDVSNAIHKDFSYLRHRRIHQICSMYGHVLTMEPWREITNLYG